MKPLLLPSLLLALWALPTAAHAASLRCEAELVSDGDTKAEVLLKCGEPASKETRTEAVRVANKVVFHTIEEWTYNFGPRRFIQIVTFRDGRLVDVQSSGYGG